MDLSKAERLAALLDGKCNDREREELLAELAAGGDDLEAFADAATLLHEPEEAEVYANVIPLRPAVQKPAARRRWPPPRWIALAAAAVLATLVVVPLLRRGGGSAEATPREIVAILSNPHAGIPAEVGTEPWASRGAVGGTLSDAERVQLGARLADLQLLAGQNDSAARAAAADIAHLLDKLATGEQLAAYYRSLERGGVAGELDPDFERRAADVGGPYTRLGAWIETARIAAAARDEAFFRSGVSRDILAGRGPAEGRVPQRDLEALRHGLEATEASLPKWGLLQTALHRLLVHLAS